MLTFRPQWAPVARWARSPKGIFTGILLLLTVPAAATSGWRLVGPTLGAAILTAALLDLPLLRWRDGSWRVPDGAMLTGWLIALVLSPYESWHTAALTSAFGIAAKHLLRVQRANVLNPAAAGLVVSYHLLGTGQSWWGALPELPLPWLALLLASGLFMAARLNKLPLVLSFLGVHFVCASVVAFLGDPRGVAELYRAPDGHMALFFATFMATDPPTSPPKRDDQLRFGILAALVSFVAFRVWGSVDFLLVGLLVANLWEGWRKRRRRAMRGRGSPVPVPA
jgi:Na+-translocating ferredoxin:NAD+ oxidoreductase RnfD subunit